MIIVVGLAGSGKSTQCQMLEETGRYRWLSVGQLLRTKITDPKQKTIIDSGDILDDQTVLPLILDEIKSYHLTEGQELILDGFPRTLDQSKWLLEQGMAIAKIVHIKASQDVTRSRLLNRGRSDDHESAINERFNEYENRILPILEYFRSKNVPILEVNGEAEPKVVNQEITAVLGVKND